MCLWNVQNNHDPVPEENSFEDMQQNGDKIYLNVKDEITKETAEDVQDANVTHNNDHMNVAKDIEEYQPDVLDLDHLQIALPIKRASLRKIWKGHSSWNIWKKYNSGSKFFFLPEFFTFNGFHFDLDNIIEGNNSSWLILNPDPQNSRSDDTNDEECPVVVPGAAVWCRLVTSLGSRVDRATNR